jgi:hypothetical protein
MKRPGLAFLLTVLLSLLAAALAVEAQQTARMNRIGWLHPGPLPSEWMEGFRHGLRESELAVRHDARPKSLTEM